MGTVAPRGFAGSRPVMSRDVPGVDVLLMPTALCAGELAHIVREQVTATNVKSKAVATLPTFRFILIGDVRNDVCFIGVFILFFSGMVGSHYPLPEIRDEVPEIFLNNFILNLR